MTLEESFKIFSWKVSDAMNAGPLLVAESRVGEKGVGLMLFFSTLTSWLYGSLDVITAVLTGLSSHSGNLESVPLWSTVSMLHKEQSHI